MTRTHHDHVRNSSAIFCKGDTAMNLLRNFLRCPVSISQRCLHGLLRMALMLTATLLLATAVQAGSLPTSTSGQTATLLPDGHWLLAGGMSKANVPQAELSLFDPATGSTRAAGTLKLARCRHTTTVLPDGTLLILGGVDADGNLVLPERFDPASGRSVVLPDTGLLLRQRHTATLLTDGRVLIAGGLDAKGLALSDAELWNPRTGVVEPGSTPATARYDHRAQLQGDAPVLVSGGKNVVGLAANEAEIFEPETGRFATLTADQVQARLVSAVLPGLSASLPGNGAQNVPIDSNVALRFTTPLDVTGVDSKHLRLTHADAPVVSRAVAAEGGLLAFVTPAAPLLGDSAYRLNLDGLHDQAGRTLPSAMIEFRTAGNSVLTASAASVAATGAGAAANQTSLKTASQARIPQTGTSLPTSEHPANPAQAPVNPPLPPNLQAAPGVTAISGHVRQSVTGEPLAGVTFTLGNVTVHTDSLGRFLVSGAPAGLGELAVDGRRADTGDFGFYKVGVNAIAGRTSPLPFIIWLTPIDRAREVYLTYPLKREVVITHPGLPGLELHLPAGSSIVDGQGQPVHRVGLTPLPLNRPPFPLPDVNVPVYFTVQPGSAYVSGGKATLVYPNTFHLASGTRYDFWNYEADGTGWYIYGKGTVTPNGTSIVPDAGVGIYEFSGAMVAGPDKSPPPGPPPPGCNNSACSPPGPDNGPPGDPDGGPPGKPRPDPPPCKGGGGSGGGGSGCSGDHPTSQDGEPVDLYTGLFIKAHTDMMLTDVWSLALTRVYRQNDMQVRAFGIGATHNYQVFLVGAVVDANNSDFYKYLQLILPDGGRVQFDRTSGSNFANSTYTAKLPGEYFGATINNIISSNYFWKMTLKDGRIYGFPESAGAATEDGAALTYMQDRNGNSVSITRDANHLITRLATQHGRTLDFTYDVSPNTRRIKTLTDNIGRVATYDYDTNGTLAKFTDPLGHTEEYGYDAGHRMTTMKDAKGTVYLTNMYDPTTGRVIKQTLADGGVYLFDYTVDSGGVLTKTTVTDPRLYKHEAGYNAAGYLTSDTMALGDPDAQVTTYARNSLNQLVTKTDPLGRQTAYTYDPAYGTILTRTWLASTAAAATTTYTYATNVPGVYNLPATVTDPLTHVTTMTYDNLGNLTQVKDATNRTVDMQYDLLGRLLKTTDALAHSTTLNYYGADLDNLSDPLGRTTRFFHDAVGRTISVQDPLNRLTVFDYDALDRVVKTTDPQGRITQTSYDPNGNRDTLTDALGHLTRWAYDPQDRLVSRTDPALKQDTFTLYDKRGNLLSRTDRKGQTTTYTWDALNRVKTVTWQDGGKVTYSYDKTNRLTFVADSQNSTLSRVYNDPSRSVTDTSPYGTVITARDLAERRMTMQVGDSSSGYMTTSYGYDNANRPTSVTQGSLNATYGYDAAGRPMGMTQPGGISRSYTLDAASQLKSIVYSNAGGSLGDLDYDYDAAGQRIRQYGSLFRATLPAVATGSYDVNNRIVQWNGAALGYDLNGNLTATAVRSLTWNARDQLASIAGNATASFLYDGLGRRQARTINGTTTRYVMDGWDMVQERDGNNAITANLFNGAGSDSLIARSDSLGTRSVLTDALGSTVELADTAGTLKTHYTYDPYGVSTTTGEANTSSYQYTGRENDLANLYYYRNRYYAPGFGRFISEDLIGFGGGVNLYAYVGGNPVSFVDPLGLDATTWNNTQGGRSRWSGPTNGNWGGKCWSGGQYSCGSQSDGNAKSTDSGDQCYKRHDNCYSSCGANAQCIAGCDGRLVNELRQLPDDSRQWPQRPRPGTEGDSERYRSGALQWFSK
jgi:RHS repeat-associated protein